MNTIYVPLKLIFFGEHLVLHGFEALAFPLQSKKFGLTYNEQPKDSLEALPDEIAQALLDDIHWIRKNYQTVHNKYSINIQSDIPPGYGAGVSAAWSVALVRLLIPDTTQHLAALAHLENRHHGQASGLDHETIFFDSVMVKQNQKTQLLNPNEFFSVALQNQTYGLISKSPPRESTKSMINIFAQEYETKKIPPLCTFAELQQIMRTHDTHKYYQCINTYGRVLEDAKVTPDRFGITAQKFRAEGGAIKICGAGARTGGFGLALAAHPDKTMIQKIADELDAYFFSIALETQ
jgi:mevalonate kinase